MARRRDSDLEDPSQWDYENAERQRPSKSARIVVSVPFALKDFDLVAAAAEHFELKTSRFIREAAVRQATGTSATTSIEFPGWTTEDRLPRLYGGQVPVIETLTLYSNTVSFGGKGAVVSGKAK